MDELTKRRLLRIFSGGDNSGWVYEMKDGKLGKLIPDGKPSPRAKEKEEMKRLSEELRNQRERNSK